MANYQEYCPKGKTDKVINFSIADDREPTPTMPCICGTEAGIDARKILSGLSAVWRALGEISNAQSFDRLAATQPPSPEPHSSAIRKTN